MAATLSACPNPTLAHFTNAVLYRRFGSENQNALEVHVTDLRLAFGADLIARTAFPRHYPDGLRERGQIPSLTQLVLPENVRTAAVQFSDADTTMMQTVNAIMEKDLVDISAWSKEDLDASTKDGSKWAEIYRLKATGDVELCLPDSLLTINATCVAMHTYLELQHVKQQMVRWGGSKVVLISAQDLATITDADRTKRAAQVVLSAYVTQKETALAVATLRGLRPQF